MSVLDAMSEKNIQAAQERLDELCKEYGMMPFGIKDKKIKSKKWQTLVLRQCGLNVEDKETGRPEDSKTWEIGSTALLLQDFGNFQKNNDLYDAVVDSKGIKHKRKAHGFTNPRNTVMRALSKIKKIRQSPTEE